MESREEWKAIEGKMVLSKRGRRTWKCLGLASLVLCAHTVPSTSFPQYGGRQLFRDFSLGSNDNHDQEVPAPPMLKSRVEVEVERPLAMSLSKRSKRRLLARTRSSAYTRAGNGPVVEYLVVVDFEATCERGQQTYEHEIIEFPAVLLRTSDAAVTSEFHAFVRPIENTTLSAFCTELTGISQEIVDEADTLDVVLCNFNTWLEENGLVFSENGRQSKGLREARDQSHPGERDAVPAPGEDTKSTFSLATDGPWDLKYFLAKECSRKGGDLAALHAESPHLHRWVNLRWLHAAFYNRPRMGVAACLRYHRLDFEGRQHSGIDDTRNIARIATCMLQDGCNVPFNDGLAEEYSVKWRIPRGQRKKGKRGKR